MMALVNDDRVPWTRLNDSLEVVTMDSAMDTSDDSRISEARICVSCGPLAKMKVKPLELAPDVTHQSSGCQIHNLQPRILSEQFLHNQSDFDRLAKPYFICN